MIPKVSNMFQSKKPKTNDVHEATDSMIDHAKLDNASTTSAVTGQMVHTTQHHSVMSRWKKVSWNATKLTLEVVNQGSGAFPPLQTVAGLLLNLINRYEVTSANKDSIQSVVKRLQYLNDSIVERGTDSGDPLELERQKRLKSRLIKISDDNQLLLKGNVAERFLNSSDDAGTLSGFVEDIRDAITDYQVSLQQDLYSKHLVSDNLNFVDKLPRCKDAGYRSGNRQPCLIGTRVELLQELEDWATSTKDLQIFWLDGMAGTGKSTIAQTFAGRLCADGILGATFFFSRDFADRSNIQLVFPTIAFQLANQFPTFRDVLVNIIKADLDVGHLSLVDQLVQLLVNPLQILAEKSRKSIPRFIVIVLDALDECKDTEPESKILSLLSDYVDAIPFIRFLITSRPESAIRQVFHRTLKYKTKELVLQDVDQNTVNRDIRTYLTTRLSALANRRNMNLDVPWPSLRDLDIMVQKCSGLFIYAFTIVNFIESRFHAPRDRLKLITSIKDNVSGEGKLIIDPLYTRVLVDGFAEVESDDSDQEYFDHLKLVIATVILAINPLPRLTLATLLDVDPSDVTLFLDPLYSVIHVPSDDTHAIHRLHKSFPDFLTDPKRCKNLKFQIDPAIYHGKIAILCLELMKKRLKRNICGIPPYTMNREVEDLHARRKEFVGDTLEYACRFWTHHVSLASKTGEGIDLMLDWLKDFFKHRFLFWIEILSILEDLGIAAHSLLRVQEWMQTISVPTLDLQKSIADCQRFVLQFFDVIQTSIRHIYHSALPSLPTNCKLLQQHVSELATEARVIGGVGSSWDACIRTIQVPGWATRVTFSRNGKLIASSIDNMVQIFDAITGICEITLRSHPDDVTSLMFSPDGSLLASSCKYSIMLWDIQTGGLVRKLEGHTDYVRTVAFSPSGTTLVSGGKDSDIRVWNAASGNCDGIIKDHSSPIYSICWISDTVVASGSEDGLIKLWDIPSRRWFKDFSSHTKRVDSVSCSAGGSKLASASSDRTIKVYDVSTGATLKTIPMHSEFASLSPKGDRLVCGWFDLEIWDLSRDIRLTIPTAHGGFLTKSACFSPDAALIGSASFKTMKLWTTEFHKGPDSEVFSMCFSEDASLFASGSNDGTVKIWEATNCSCLFTLTGSTSDIPITSIAFSPNRTLVGAGSKGAVWIWDIESQKLRATIDRSNVEAELITFSSDGSKLASVSYRYNPVSVLHRHKHVSPWNIRIRVWDTETGSLLAFRDNDTYRSIKWMTFSDSHEIVVQADGKLEKWNLCAVSTSSPTIGTSEEMARGTSAPFDVVLSTDDEPTIQPPPLSYRLKETLIDSRRTWDNQWIVDSQGRRVFHWLDGMVSACHMTKLAVGTSTGRVAILDFSNIT